jgi:hypothetical protein
VPKSQEFPTLDLSSYVESFTLEQFLDNVGKRLVIRGLVYHEEEQGFRNTPITWEPNAMAASTPLFLEPANPAAYRIGCDYLASSIPGVEDSEIATGPFQIWSHPHLQLGGLYGGRRGHVMSLLVLVKMCYLTR